MSKSGRSTTYRENQAGLERTSQGLISASSGNSCVDASCIQPRASARAQIAAVVPELLKEKVSPVPQKVLPRHAKGVCNLGTKVELGQLGRRTVFQVPLGSPLHQGVEPEAGATLIAFVDSVKSEVMRAFVPKGSLRNS